MRRAVSISLKIPDNTAYTALVALRRLDVAVDRIERSDIWLMDDGGDIESLRKRVISDETVFNPNKHRLRLLDGLAPGDGAVWIASLVPGCGPAAVAWQLFDASGRAVGDDVLDAAIERLLCNPAIDRAITKRDPSNRDILGASE
ncbi:MAG: hypothetical protein JOZ77_01870 [Candidatus Eremiobacteraeota bacterium]|nr:hypothetical protein [Candidatus Eremiobacteraeota bacterium]